VSENGDRPNANQANCPGWKPKPLPAGGVNATAVVSPRSAVTPATCQGRASARRGFISRTQSSRQTKAADIRAHRICFHSELTYSSTNRM
jgi:hypothetical protein